MFCDNINICSFMWFFFIHAPYFAFFLVSQCLRFWMHVLCNFFFLIYFGLGSWCIGMLICCSKRMIRSNQVHTHIKPLLYFSTIIYLIAVNNSNLLRNLDNFVAGYDYSRLASLASHILQLASHLYRRHLSLSSSRTSGFPIEDKFPLLELALFLEGVRK